MNPELPPPQPALRPPPSQAISDRDVLTPNQRIVFFAAFLFLGVGLLVSVLVTTYLSWNVDVELWAATDLSRREDSPSLLEHLLPSAAGCSVAACPLFLIIAVLEGRQRKYMLESPFRGGYAPGRPGI